MKKLMYAMIIALVVVSGLLFANREIKNQPPSHLLLLKGKLP